MKRFVILAVTVLVVTVMAPVANATFAPISPASAGELSLLGSGGILDTLYGLSNLERISDAFIHDDQLWELTGSGASAKVVAKFAGFSEDFGVISGSTGGTFTSLLTQAANINPLTDSPGLAVPLPALTGEFPLGTDLSGAPLWSSRQSDNADGALDHMVAWRIISTGNYVLPWEDAFGLGDHDYNDLVLQVNGAAPASPESGALLLTGSGLVGMGAAARRRNRRK